MILLNKKDVLSTQDLDGSEILSLISRGRDFKSRKIESRQLLKGKTLGLIFQKPSTRTRVSFEVAMFQMGGNSIYLNSNELQMSRGETLEDTAKTLSLYLDCIVARVYSHAHLQELAHFSKIPVINGLSDLFHPCQTLADLMTIIEHKNHFKGLQLAWIGDGNNVCSDLLIGCMKTGISVTAAIPKGFEPPTHVLDIVRTEAYKNNCAFNITREPTEAVKNADIVVTDTFVSIGTENEQETRRAIFLPKYQVNSQLMKSSKADSIFMHCLPAKREEEVTADVIDGKSSAVWKEAENRLHIQKALLEYILVKYQYQNSSSPNLN
ncbi:MAG: ornithine carbamoyltransferase [Thermoproteota archaeon]|nr:ornithine carbamoyltransferase [Thermoproteota archaeon]